VEADGFLRRVKIEIPLDQEIQQEQPSFRI